MKPILANLGTRIFKNLSQVQTVVVSTGKQITYSTAFFIFIKFPSLKVGSAVLELSGSYLQLDCGSYLQLARLR